MRLRLLLALTLVVTACAESGSGPPAATSPATDATVPTTTSSQPDGTTSTAPSAGEDTDTTRPAPNPERPLAPEFSLILSDGAEYRLAHEVRPVYLVFWAEW